MSHILHEEILFPHLIYSSPLQVVEPYQALHILRYGSLSTFTQFRAWKINPLISFLQCCEPCNFLLKLFVNNVELDLGIIWQRNALIILHTAWRISFPTSNSFFHITRCGALSIPPHYKVWNLINPSTLQGVEPYQSLHITRCGSLSTSTHFRALKINPLISSLHCCELCNFPLKLFVNIHYST